MTNVLDMAIIDIGSWETEHKRCIDFLKHYSPADLQKAIKFLKQLKGDPVNATYRLYGEENEEE